jgi:hypothetical protein
LNYASSPFLLWHFWARVLRFCPSQPEPWSSSLCFLLSWDDRNTPPWPAFFFSSSSRVWIQDLRVSRQVLYHLSHSASPWPDFLIWVRSHFFLGWPQTKIFLSSPLRSTGVSHCAQPHYIPFDAITSLQS